MLNTIHSRKSSAKVSPRRKLVARALTRRVPGMSALAMAVAMASPLRSPEIAHAAEQAAPLPPPSMDFLQQAGASAPEMLRAATDQYNAGNYEESVVILQK